MIRIIMEEDGKHLHVFNVLLKNPDKAWIKIFNLMDEIIEEDNK